MTLLWPHEALVPRVRDIWIAERSVATPASIDGLVQVVSSDAGIWRCVFSDILINTHGKVRTWRAIRSKLKGRQVPLLVPVCRIHQPVPDDATDLYAPVPHSDGSFFDDGSGYVGQVIDIVSSTSAEVRSTQLSVSINYAGLLQPSHVFSIADRLYEITDVVYSGDSSAVLSINPPLRDAIVSGAQFEFDNPVCRMRLASDGEMATPIELLKYAKPTVNFIEDL